MKGDVQPYRKMDYKPRIYKKNINFFTEVVLPVVSQAPPTPLQQECVNGTCTDIQLPDAWMVTHPTDGILEFSVNI